MEWIIAEKYFSNTTGNFLKELNGMSNFSLNQIIKNVRIYQ